jgi:ATP synthase protein I
MTEPQKTNGSKGSGEPTSLTSDLATRISRARQERRESEAGEASATNNMSGMARGLRLGSEFVAAVAVGFGMGWVLDTWLNTTPWFMLVMLMIGFAAGVLNVVRSAKEMNMAASPPTAAKRAPDDEEDE